MHFSYVLFLVLVTTLSISSTLFPVVAAESSDNLIAQEKSLDTFKSPNQAQDGGAKFLRALKEIETSDEEERGMFNFSWLKKLIPGSSSWKAAQTAKALKSASKQVRAQLAVEWVGNPRLYDKIVKNDQDLFATFKVWKGLGYSEDFVYRGMQAVGKTSKEYMEIFHRYKIYLADISPRVRVAAA